MNQSLAKLLTDAARRAEAAAKSHVRTAMKHLQPVGAPMSPRLERITTTQTTSRTTARRSTTMTIGGLHAWIVWLRALRQHRTKDPHKDNFRVVAMVSVEMAEQVRSWTHETATKTASGIECADEAQQGFYPF